MSYMLPFEKPLLEFQHKLDELKKFAEESNISVEDETARLRKELQAARRELYSHLTPWQEVMVARHPLRPYTGDYISAFIDDFTELHGDRLVSDDQSILGGFGKLNGHRVMVIGTQKGRDTKSNLACNFGCPFPEGYRKALRLMSLAAKFRLPIVTFIDTPGAFPGVEGESRHVAEAIAVNLREMFTFPVPILSVVIGEGGSGGALGIGVANRILVMEYAYYSVISPEGCAAILWKDRAAAPQAAAALKITAPDLLSLGIADAIVPEPLGGAHRDPAAAAQNVRNAIVAQLDARSPLSEIELLGDRYRKFRSLSRLRDPAIQAV